MIPSRIFRAVLGLIFLSVFSSVALAQSGQGSISGSVHDSSGAIVPGAKVTVINQATNQTIELESNASGVYTVPEVPVGTYEVRVEKQGFSQADVKGLTVNAAETARAEIVLQIGQSRQIIEVEAAAVQVNSEDSRTSVTVNQTLVNE